MNKIIGLLIVALALVGCSGSPGNVAVEYLENMRDGKFKEAAELAAQKTKPRNDANRMASLSDEAIKAHIEKGSGVQFDVINARVRGTRATVEVERTFSGKVSTNIVTLVDEEGDWRVQEVKDKR